MDLESRGAQERASQPRDIERCFSPENPLLGHGPVDVHVDVHAVLSLHLVVRHLPALETRSREIEKGGKSLLSFTVVEEGAFFLFASHG